ncbi:5-enolpyruvylshikimate-3-phosphate synthase [Bradyrhizobium elkanii]|nr:5-enolpyruvylshikimate-3-phosphate synthase [Bradyrhizobium elkanii]
MDSVGIAASAPTGRPPVMVEGRGHFGSGHVEIDGSLSSQYVSALLMASPYGEGPIDSALAGRGLDARGYVDLTVAAMSAFGAKVGPVDRTTWRIEPTRYTATDFVIEPDASGSTYLWAAEALTDGRIDLGVPMEAFTQPDAQAAEFIRMFPRLPAVIDGSQMQDAVPTLAVLAAFNDTRVRFTGIASRRVKECDRMRHHGTPSQGRRASLKTCSKRPSRTSEMRCAPRTARNSSTRSRCSLRCAHGN